MSTLLILAIVALAVQILMFFVIRSKKQKLQFPSKIAKKYGIQSRADAWKLMNDPDLSDEDRSEVEDLYNSM